MTPVHLKSYLNLINKKDQEARSANQNFIQTPHSRKKAFSSTFFPYYTDEWNKLNPGIQKIEFYKNFKSKKAGGGQSASRKYSFGKTSENFWQTSFILIV